MPLPVLAIVGRPNVGKSALFNRLTQTRQALVHDMSGVTRDRMYGHLCFDEYSLRLIDTGGLVPDAADSIEEHVAHQVDLALDEAQVVLFIVDGKAGCIALDLDIADRLRRRRLPVVVGVNKVDEFGHLHRVDDFRRLGFKDIVGISAIHGLGIDELVEAAVPHLQVASNEDQERPLRVALVGKPNVGKSSLVNRLVEEDRLIVSPVAGTTREAIEVPFRIDEDGRSMVLIDTAGLRRRGKARHGVEGLMRMSSERAVRMSDIVLVLLDAAEPLSHGDKTIAGLVQKAHRPSLLVLNKTDLLEDPHNELKEWSRELDGMMPWFTYAPRARVSAATGKGTGNLLKVLGEVAARHAYRMPTPLVNRLVREAMIVHPPPVRKGRPLKIYYAVQIPDRPATFLLRVNDPELAHFSFRRYLENVLRNAGDFDGFPLTLRFEKRDSGRKAKAEDTAMGAMEKDKKASGHAKKPTASEMSPAARKKSPAARKKSPAARKKSPAKGGKRGSSRGGARAPAEPTLGKSKGRDRK